MLDPEACALFEILTGMLFNRYEDPSAEQRVDGSRTFTVILFLFEKCFDTFAAALEKPNKDPTCQQHQETWNRLLRALAHLFHLAAMLPKTEDQEAKLDRYLRRMKEMAPKTIHSSTSTSASSRLPTVALTTLSSNWGGSSGILSQRSGCSARGSSVTLPMRKIQRRCTRRRRE